MNRELSGAFMSLSLAEALGQVDLESGRVYVCQVKGHWVELRVLGTAEVPTLAAYDESVVMLDPWVEFPQPTSKLSVIAEFGPTPLPDVPEIPNDEAYDESDVMLDPWVEFPQPKSGILVTATPGSLPLPDVPEIPRDDDDQ
jgi:hypothetical protein